MSWFMLTAQRFRSIRRTSVELQEYLIKNDCNIGHILRKAIWKYIQKAPNFQPLKPIKIILYDLLTPCLGLIALINSLPDGKVQDQFTTPYISNHSRWLPAQHFYSKASDVCTKLIFPCIFSYLYESFKHNLKTYIMSKYC